jgi:hypothetical protein
MNTLLKRAVNGIPSGFSVPIDKAASIIKLLVNYILLSHELYACYTYKTKFHNRAISVARHSFDN